MEITSLRTMRMHSSYSPFIAPLPFTTLASTTFCIFSRLSIRSNLLFFPIFSIGRLNNVRSIYSSQLNKTCFKIIIFQPEELFRPPLPKHQEYQLEQNSVLLISMFSDAYMSFCELTHIHKERGSRVFSTSDLYSHDCSNRRMV